MLDIYRIKFEVRRFDNVPLDFMVTPVELLVDGFGKVYYRVEGVKPTKVHVRQLITANGYQSEYIFFVKINGANPAIVVKFVIKIDLTLLKEADMRISS